MPPPTYVFRYGHRANRDHRISTHVGLVARAFGAFGMYYCGDRDEKLEEKIKDVVERWGGSFEVHYVKSWKSFVEKWRGKVVHLTMYGIPLPDVIDKIRKLKKPILVFVGGQKVPGEIYELADYNVSVTLQPHSEVAALAVFLDRLYKGKMLKKAHFENAKIRIIPQEKGKKIVVTK